MNLLFPAGLFMGLLAGPLVAMYFLRLRRKRVKVPSLLLWHALQRAEQVARPFDRFKRHLLLLLQLLVLAALVLALARPTLTTEAASFDSLVIVVDTSASMGALDGEPTRLDDAKARALEALAALGPSDEVMLIEAGPRTEVRVPFTRDAGDVRRVLDTLAPTEAQGGLAQGLTLALSLSRSRPEVEVLVLSDGGNEDLSALPTTTATVTFARVGRSDRNVGFTALDLRRSPTNELERQLFVTAQNFSGQPVLATVELLLGSELIGLRTETLPPKTPVSMVFELEAGRAGVLHARLDVPDDLLPADNHAYALLGPVSTRRVVLVGRDALAARALKADPRVELQVLTPEQATEAALQEADAVLYLQGTPPSLEGRNLAILSRRVPGPAELGALVPLPTITHWERSHPLLRFVDLQGATVAQSASVGALNGMVSLVDADTGPLLLAGESRGHRRVQLAFDPYESDLPMRVAWPVFLLNTVGWLTERTAGSSDAQLVPAGQPYLRTLAGASGTATVTGPQKTQQVGLSGELLRVLDTDRVGVYRIQAGPVSTAFVANLLSAAESRIAPAAELLVGQSGAAPVASALKAGQRELWRPLLALALVLLLLEWFVYHRRSAA